MKLTITDRNAGDNYIVRASLDENFRAEQQTALLTAWKRVYLERDKMFRQGTFLRAGCGGDGNTDPDELELADADCVDEDDIILIFDTAHPDGEERQVLTKNGNIITVRDLANGYEHGTWNGKYAAIGLIASGYYEAPVSALPSAYEDAYIEWVAPSDGSGHVPLQEEQTLGQADDLRDHWFKNAGKSNYIYLCGADKSDGGGRKKGRSDPSANANWSFVYWNACSVADEEVKEASAADTVVHELGHQCTLSAGLFNHVDMGQADPGYVRSQNHSGSDECVMDYECDGLDGISDFCVECLYRIRDAEDDL